MGVSPGTCGGLGLARTWAPSLPFWTPRHAAVSPAQGQCNLALQTPAVGRAPLLSPAFKALPGLPLVSGH